MVKSCPLLLLFFLSILLFSSCKVFYPDLMLRTEKDFPYSPSDSMLSREYVIRPNDALNIQVFSNNGYKLIDVMGPAGQTTTTGNTINYLVKNEGFAILPLLDSVYLAGYTLSAAENLLSKKYAYYFVNPFVRITVSNRRCFVFSGRGSGKVINLTNENMSLLEVLAVSGGITGGKAYSIKIIRGELSNPKIIKIDLSTIEGMKKSNLQIDANDVIYVEPVLSVTAITDKIIPYLTLITTTLLVYSTLTGLKQKI